MSVLSSPFDNVGLLPGSSKSDPGSGVVVGAHAECVSEAQVLEFVLTDKSPLPNCDTRFLRPAAHFST